MPDSIVHFEIPADNVKRAQTFYKKAFGWQITAIPEMDYTSIGTAPSDKNGMPKKPGAINGGMFKREAPLKNPIVTVNVKSIEEALKDIKKLGGSTVRRKVRVADMGWAAYFKDTEGNILGLWQNATE